MNEVLRDLHRETCVNWIDDLLVYAVNDAEYLRRLDEILARYEKYKVKSAIKKFIYILRQEDQVVWTRIRERELQL